MEGVPDEKVKDTAEFFENQSQVNAQNSTLNSKRTFDDYQHAALEHIRNNQRLFEQSAANLQTQLAAINNITTQHLQNAVQVAQKISQDIASTADAQNKQYLKHADLAADSFWNPVSAGAGMNLAAGSVPANRVTDTAAAGVAATIPASSDARIVATVGELVSQVAALTALVAQLVQNAKQTPAQV